MFLNKSQCNHRSLSFFFVVLVGFGSIVSRALPAFPGKSLSPNVAAPRKPVEFSRKGCQIIFLGFSGNGKTLAYAIWPRSSESDQSAGAVVVWDVVSGKEIKRIAKLAVGGDLSTDGKTLALRIEGAPVSLWDVATGKELCQCEQSNVGACPSQFAFLPDGRTLAGCYWRGDVFFWDTANGKLVRRLGSARGGVNYFAICGDGKYMLAEHEAHRQEDFDPKVHKERPPRGGKINVTDVTHRLWDLNTGKEVALTGGPYDSSVDERRFGGRGRFSLTWGTQQHGFRVRFSPAGQPLFFPTARMFPFTVDFRSPVLYDPSTEKTLRHFEDFPQHLADDVVFCPDGSALALLHRHGHVVIYDVSDLIEHQRMRLARPTPRELDALWLDLATTNSGKARGAFLALSCLPRLTALAFLKDRVRPVVSPGAERVAALITDLNSDSYAVRAKAHAELEAAGADVEPALRTALNDKRSLEQAKRLTQILTKLKDREVSGETIRYFLVIDFLEQQQTPEAQALLEVLANGPNGAWVTEEAKSSLSRLRKT
jgi:hypothetical protein